MANSTKNQYQHPSSPEEALQQQKALRQQIDLTPLSHEVKYVGGADLSFNLYEDVVYAGIIVLELPSLKPIVQAVVQSMAGFPYIPGFLSFREIPALLQVWEQLAFKPDVLMLDGHGIAHPRRMGIATHFGLLTGFATLGCAKKKLTGSYQEPAQEQGSSSPLIHQKEVVGCAYRTKKNTKPVFISPGNGLSLADAIQITRSCTGRYRIPEPTRQAHLLVNRFRKGEETQGLTWFADPPGHQ